MTVRFIFNVSKLLILFHRRLLWLNVVSMPLVTACWLLCLISASEHDPMLTYSMCGVIVLQSWFLLIGYCISNSRVRYGLYRLFLQIVGRKLPPLDDEDDIPHASTPRSGPGQQPTVRVLILHEHILIFFFDIEFLYFTNIYSLLYLTEFFQRAFVLKDNGCPFY